MNDLFDKYIWPVVRLAGAIREVEASEGQCQGMFRGKRCPTIGLLGEGLCATCWDADRPYFK